LASIINSTDTGSGGLITTGDSSDELQIQTAETTALTITSGQQSVFIAGTAAAPAVTTTGDLNTGIFFSAADTLVVTTGGTAAVTVDSGQRTKFPTTIGVGDATPSASGSGISFPATQSASSDANTLDDYEEGTFDVTVTMGTSGTCTMDSSTNKMRYTKIGRMVTIQGQVQVSSVASPVGTMQMSLPFAIGAADEGSNLSGCVPRLYNVAKPASGLYPYVYLQDSNAFMRMQWVTDNAATIEHVPAAGNYFIINFSYFTS
jgi:hypothetical protein